MTHYVIVPERSLVEIEGRSSVHPIHSRTTGLEGFINIEFGGDGRVDPTDRTAAPSGRLSLPVERLTSGNPIEDRELKRRIEARRFPTIDGVLTELSAVGAGGTDGTDDRYVVSGEITFRGETRAYEHEMTIERLDDHTVRLTGEASFDIRDFGMEPPRILLLRVEPDVVVRVEIIAASAD
jgi:polyisoprenoid-binding protein YceI